MTVRELIEALEALNQDKANVVVCALADDPYISASQDLHHIEVDVDGRVMLLGDHSDMK